MLGGWILILEDPEVYLLWNIMCGQPGLRIDGPIQHHQGEHA